MPYRVVRDRYLGYEAQYRPWWSPVWREIAYRWHHGNTSATLEGALKVCDWHAKRQVVYHYTPRS